MSSIKLKIGDFLGFCDLNGIDAINSEKFQELEQYVTDCHEAMNEGNPLVPDAIYDRLIEILRKVDPENELCKYIWEDSNTELDDNDELFRNNPMYSIQTVKSFDCDEINNYVKRLPEDLVFDAHISVKLNGHGIRLVYNNGVFERARSRARSSAGRDITSQLKVVLERNGLIELDELSDLDACEIRGEWVLPFSNVDRAREFNPDIKSAFSGVASMGRDSATEEEWNLLQFVAYEFIADGVSFNTKSEEYEFLSELGFEVPLNWVIEDLPADSLIEELKSIVSDCEDEIKPDENGESGYEYYTDGLVFTINDLSLFRSLGDDGSHYKFGNMALKVGYWKQDMYTGYIQTIMWKKGKTKLSPVAIVAEERDVVEFVDGDEHPYILSQKEIDATNWKNELGVVTAGGNRVRRVPLYEPSNMTILDAYAGNLIHFHYGGEAGVVPCFEDGTPLVDGRAKQLLEDDDEEYCIG